MLPLLAFGLAVLTGCGPASKAAPAGGPPGGGMPPPEVSVVTVAPEAVPVTTELPGRVNAMRMAEVRARATGLLLKRQFEEGADVQAGQLLFEIDPAPLQASYDSAKASLAKAEATVEQAEAKAKRDEGLVKINGVSQQAYEDSRAAALQSAADVLAAKAALEMASLNLGYARVTAPISGRIGRALVTEGAYVIATDATKLAVIQQLDPVYVDFTQSSAEMLRLRRALESGKMQSLASNDVKVSLRLEDGSLYPTEGRLLFSDITVDETTGSVTLRAAFTNSERLLLPGMFVRGRIEVGVDRQALTVPQRAVSRDATGHASVLLVNAQNQVEPREIEADTVFGDRWVVTGGLKAGERVIVEGLQKVRPGAPVVATPFASSGTNSAPAQTPASHP